MDKEKIAEAQLLAREILTGDVLFADIEHFLKPWVQVGDMGAALEKSLKNPDTNDFDAGVSVAAAMLRDGARMPDWLAVFAADVLEGKRKRPTNRGRDAYANWIRDYKIASAVFEISTRFSLPHYTKSDTSSKLTAAEVVADSGHLSLDVVHHAVRRFGGEIKRIISPQSSKY